jgi:hypothetical protein
VLTAKSFAAMRLQTLSEGRAPERAQTGLAKLARMRVAEVIFAPGARLCGSQRPEICADFVIECGSTSHKLEKR